jgi:hypothetical protein
MEKDIHERLFGLIGKYFGSTSDLPGQLRDFILEINETFQNLEVKTRREKISIQIQGQRMIRWLVPGMITRIPAGQKDSANRFHGMQQSETTSTFLWGNSPLTTKSVIICWEGKYFSWEVFFYRYQCLEF